MLLWGSHQSRRLKAAEAPMPLKMQCCTKLLTKRVAQFLLPIADPEAVVARRVEAVLVLCSKAAQSGGEGFNIVREVSCKFSTGSYGPMLPLLLRSSGLGGQET